MTDREQVTINPTGEGFEPPLIRRWRAEFPYHWDADDLVSRRELLRFAVLTSGALFASTALLALLSVLRGPRRTLAQPIAAAADIPVGEAFYFHYPEPDDEAVLLHLPGGQFVAYNQRCTHLSCAVYYQSEERRLFCPCHDGVFDPQTGSPLAGPPQRRLARIALRQEAGVIYAVEQTP